MATKKQTTTQSGAASDAAAPPFATRAGAVPGVGPMAGKPTDFIKNASSQQPAQRSARGRDFTAEGRAQQAPPAAPVAEERDGSYGEGRVDPESIARGGIVTRANAGDASRAIGADGGAQPARSPFKNMK